MVKTCYIVYEHHRPPGWLLQENDITTTLVGVFTTHDYAQALVDWCNNFNRDVYLGSDEFYKYEIIEQPLDAHPPAMS
jgi:hypothetical protein